MQRIALPIEPRARSPARTHLSHSSITTYQACPLRYYFHYVLGLEEDRVSSNLVLGSAIHAAVQVHFDQMLAEGVPPDLDTLLAAFWDEWQTRDPEAITYPRGEDITSIARLAERMLRAFQRSAFAWPAGQIIAVEEELKGQLPDGMPELLARIDLLVDAGDSLVLTDLKTARSAWSFDHVLDAASQLWLYSHLIEPMAAGKPVRLQFAVLTKAAIPEVVIHNVPSGQERTERALRIVQRVWRAIEAEHFYPSPSPVNCPTCPFRKRCRAWNG